MPEEHLRAALKCNNTQKNMCHGYNNVLKSPAGIKQCGNHIFQTSIKYMWRGWDSQRRKSCILLRELCNGHKTLTIHLLTVHNILKSYENHFGGIYWNMSRHCTRWKGQKIHSIPTRTSENGFVEVWNVSFWVYLIILYHRISYAICSVTCSLCNIMLHHLTCYHKLGIHALRKKVEINLRIIHHRALEAQNDVWHFFENILPHTRYV